MSSDEVMLEIIVINNLEELLDKLVEIEQQLIKDYDGDIQVLKSYAYRIVEVVMNHVSGV